MPGKFGQYRVFLLILSLFIFMLAAAIAFGLTSVDDFTYRGVFDLGMIFFVASWL